MKLQSKWYSPGIEQELARSENSFIPGSFQFLLNVVGIWEESTRGLLGIWGPV
jgi:hypothetical protein